MSVDLENTLYSLYQRQGYLIHPEPIIPQELLERATAGMDAIRNGQYDTRVAPPPSPWSPGDDPRKLCKVELPQIANRAIRELIGHPALGALAASVTGAQGVQVWWVQLLYKPPLDARADGKTTVGLHQDRQYWSCWEPESELFTAWLALSDVTLEAGPMYFVEGSHTWGYLDQGDFYGQDLDAQRREIETAQGKAWNEVPAILQPGGVSFHDRLTVHGSGPNRSGAPRRSFAIHMRTDKSRPIGGLRQGLTQFIDDPAICPVIFGGMD